MIQLIQDLPADVVGIEASGKITREDYENILIPEIERRFKVHKKLNFLYRMGEDFSMTPGAMWDDLKIGVAHYSAWKKGAIVSDSTLMRDLTRFIGVLIPCEIRVFKNSEFDEAKRWISLSD